MSIEIDKNEKTYYLLAEESTVEGEFSPLKDLRSDFPKYVLSLDEIDRSHEGITHMNIRDFLLNSDTILADS